MNREPPGRRLAPTIAPGAGRSIATPSSLAPLAIGAALAHAQSEPPPSAQTSALEQVDEGPILWRQLDCGRGHQRRLPGPRGAAARRGRGLLHLGPRHRARAQPRLAALGRGHHDPGPAAGAGRIPAAHPGQRASASPTSAGPTAGPFGRRYGGLGHASHQNGLDVDLYYPRTDRQERSITVGLADRRRPRPRPGRRFVKAGAVYVFVGPEHRARPQGPPAGRTVQRLVHHDDHMHVRFRAGAAAE